MSSFLTTYVLVASGCNCTSLSHQTFWGIIQWVDMGLPVTAFGFISW